MPEASDAKGILRQNLLDAGCGPEAVRQCMGLAGLGERGELLRVLSAHRRGLLDLLHQKEKQIDCLDYLIYQLQKQNQS